MKARSYLLFLCQLCLATLLLPQLSAHAAVDSTIKDIEGLNAWVRTPTAAPEPGKTYWLLVSVHGAGNNGSKGVGWFADWKDNDDVILLGPTFGPPKESGAAGWIGSYQMSGPSHEAKLQALIAEIGRTWKLHPKIILNGFSAGAQFAHRFAFHHPELVAGVAAHSGGSWAKTEGEDLINLAARRIPFAVSCGEDDQGRGSPDPKTPTRIEGVRQFASNLALLGFDVDLRSWPAVGHQFSPGANAQTRALVERVRAAAASKPIQN